MWPQMRCRKAFGSSIADDMMCVSKKKKPIDATCNVGWGSKLNNNYIFFKVKDNMMCFSKKRSQLTLPAV